MATTATTTTTATSLPAAKLTATQPAPTAAPVARPYKDFLTPLLHRRSTHAALLVLAFCWVESIYLSTSSSLLWRWFPVGLTGIRTLLLFVPCLAVFIVRVMNMEVGRRTTTSGFETLVQRVTEGRTWMTVSWYVLSAWFFGEVYIWSSSEEAELGWIDYGRAYERPRGNENPVLLRSLLFIFSIGQAFLHLYHGRDALRAEEMEKTANQPHDETQESKLPHPMQVLSSKARSIVGTTLSSTFVGVVFSFVIYELFLRNIAWNCMAYPMARILVRQLPPNTGPSGLIHPFMLIRQAFSSCAMLVGLWEVSNTIFTVYVNQLPLKREEPLTNEVKDASGRVLSKSTDPNGSLIRGLKAKKTVPKAFAFWELQLITSQFETRRRTFFNEVDRKPESTWAQISALCLAEISAISDRIQKANEPTEYQKRTAESEQQRKQQEYLIAQEREKKLGLPRIAQRGVSDERDVFAKQKGDALHAFGDAAKSFGQSPGAVNPVTPRARKAIEWTESRTGMDRTNMTASNLQQQASQYSLKALDQPFGEPFRQTFARRVCAVVFGVPFSGKANILHSAEALTRLAITSLKEDDYGQAAPSIPIIIRTFTTCITDVTTFQQTLTPHWTDVTFQESDRRVPEVEETLAVVKSGLEEVVLAFGEYATSLGLSAKELREAREAVGRRDMQQKS